MIQAFLLVHLAEGRLHDEVSFTQEQYGFNEVGDIEYGSETIIQTVKEGGGGDILTARGMKEHLDMLRKVLHMEVKTNFSGEIE